MRGIPHKDSQTGEQFYAKNLIMIQVKDLLLDDPEDKGRRELYNIGKGKKIINSILENYYNYFSSCFYSFSNRKCMTNNYHQLFPNWGFFLFLLE